MKRSFPAAFGLLLLSSILPVDEVTAQQRWQQRVKYTMNIDMDVTAHTFTGKQKLEYTNNSPDTLGKLFYHLYWNAFQPNSMMDARSRHLGTVRVNNRPEWDQRVKDRIANLKPDETGSQKVTSLTIGGVAQKMTEHETILEVSLAKPLLPGSKTVIDLEFSGQVPVQVRRSGRQAANGVAYSMSQWYPKLCEYDRDGWHANPYVAREFYGVWGDYDVKINIDSKYILGGTGYLQNPRQIGYGYEAAGSTVTRATGGKLQWHFVAPDVHDFVWAADPDYKHLVRKIANGPEIHVLYKTGADEQWKEIADAAVAVFPFITRNFGEYPYKQYSFIQGGDGGMEYPMATLLNGPGLGTALHEWMHTWYQMLLATDESQYAWMDEGFTEWATDKVQHFYQQTVIRERQAGNAAALRSLDSAAATLPRYHAENYAGYYYLTRTGLEESLSTPADFFETNTAYGLASYAKGCVFLSQLGYITGDQALAKIMLNYYRQWRFKHPHADDFLRVAEKTSGLQLDWYKAYWVNSTKTIDYAIDSLWEQGPVTRIRLKRLGKMPMPVDVNITYKDGTQQTAYIPMYLMFGSKPEEKQDTGKVKLLPRIAFAPWKWTHDTYTIDIPGKISAIRVVEIDASQRMADVERRNNRLEIPL